jgi:hypothetical protein
MTTDKPLLLEVGQEVWIRGVIDGKPTAFGDYEVLVVDKFGDKRRISFFPHQIVTQSWLTSREAVWKEVVEALKRISTGQLNTPFAICNCTHNDENCCEKVGEWCPQCIAAAALSKLQAIKCKGGPVAMLTIAGGIVLGVLALVVLFGFVLPAVAFAVEEGLDKLGEWLSR